MFAGATREVVFSNSDVVERIRDDFIPVAIKAGRVPRKYPGVEGQIYAEIHRTKAVPQGICTLNSSGKVLAWVYSFEKESSIVQFLDHVKRRFKESPRNVTTVERFGRFPHKGFPDLPGATFPNDLTDVHVDGEVCPGNPPRPDGILTTRIIGRPLNATGQPIKSTYRQEEYMEATFEVPVGIQEQVINACRSAEGRRFNLPDSFSRALIGSTYLGQLDSQPMGRHQGRNRFANWEFNGQAKPAVGDGTAKEDFVIEVTGFSDVSGEVSQARRPAVFWEHRVRLHWRESVQISKNRMRGLRLLAEGHEKLVWDLPGNAIVTATDVQRLMSGHEINLDTEVRYGVITEDE